MVIYIISVRYLIIYLLINSLSLLCRGCDSCHNLFFISRFFCTLELRILNGGIVMKSHETLTLIEEITRNDGSRYFEISNIVQNGRAELAAIRGFIKEVRIVQLNIPRSKNVIAYENYINENFEMPEENFDHFEEWKRTPEMEEVVENILHENHVA